jgi:hypothetical protein
MRKKFLTCFIIFVFMTLTSLNAQLCFRGRPSPECKWFTITEFGALAKISQGSEGPFHQLFTWELGAMHNLNRSNALGATLYASFTKQSEVYGGFKLRFRKWIGPAWSLEGGAGPIWRLNYPESGMHFTGHIGLNYKDYVILTGHVDFMEKTVVYIGIRTGALPGAAASLLSAAVLGIRYFILRLD